MNFVPLACSIDFTNLMNRGHQALCPRNVVAQGVPLPARSAVMWHFLYLLPEPQWQGS